MEFKRETLQHDLGQLVCRQCGEHGATLEFTALDGPHFAKISCINCSSFIEWCGYSDAPSDRKKSRRKIRDLSDRCEICLRHAADIPPPGLLEVHRVIEKTADGTDDIDNLRPYCTACHSLVNWARIHFGHYHPQ